MASRYWCNHKIAITVTGPGVHKTIVIAKPYARIGSAPGCDIVLSAVKALPRRCVYLHATVNGLFAVILIPGNIEGPMWHGWLAPNQRIEIGDFVVRAQLAGVLEAGGCHELAKLDTKLDDLGSAARIQVAFRGRAVTSFKLARQLTVVGSKRPSTLRIKNSRISSCHFALFQDSTGLWAIDLASHYGCEINGQDLDVAKMTLGDVLRIHDVCLRYVPGNRKQVVELRQSRAKNADFAHFEHGSRNSKRTEITTSANSLDRPKNVVRSTRGSRTHVTTRKTRANGICQGECRSAGGNSTIHASRIEGRPALLAEESHPEHRDECIRVTNVFTGQSIQPVKRDRPDIDEFEDVEIRLRHHIEELGMNFAHFMEERNRLRKRLNRIRQMLRGLNKTMAKLEGKTTLLAGQREFLGNYRIQAEDVRLDGIFNGDEILELLAYDRENSRLGELHGDRRNGNGTENVHAKINHNGNGNNGNGHDRTGSRSNGAPDVGIGHAKKSNGHVVPASRQQLQTTDRLATDLADTQGQVREQKHKLETVTKCVEASVAEFAEERQLILVEQDKLRKQMQSERNDLLAMRQSLEKERDKWEETVSRREREISGLAAKIEKAAKTLDVKRHEFAEERHDHENALADERKVLADRITAFTDELANQRRVLSLKEQELETRLREFDTANQQFVRQRDDWESKYAQHNRLKEESSRAPNDDLSSRFSTENPIPAGEAHVAKKSAVPDEPQPSVSSEPPTDLKLESANVDPEKRKRAEEFSHRVCSRLAKRQQHRGLHLAALLVLASVIVVGVVIGGAYVFQQIRDAAFASHVSTPFDLKKDKFLNGSTGAAKNN